jgi:hypothetical protein
MGAMREAIGAGRFADWATETKRRLAGSTEAED